jgi:elongation factor G
MGRDATPPVGMRNVVMLGHGGTGKTRLGQALLALGEAGANGVFDTEPEARERGHTLGLATASARWRNHEIHILDTPGQPDFVGDAYPALLAADVAVFVVDATAGVQPVHDALWEACDRVRLPRLVFLNKLDKANAAYQSVIDALRERCGKPLAPVHMPMGIADEFTGVIDLLHFTAALAGGEQVDVPDERADQARRNRETLVEAIVETDDGLLERYLEGEEPDPKDLAECFAHGIATSRFFPVLCGSADKGVGVPLLADFFLEECPAPSDDDGRPAAYVAKTLSDPYLGRVSVVRVLSGTIATDDTLVCARSGADVTIRSLFHLSGGQQTTVRSAAAGAIVATSKLEDVRTGDTLHAKGAEVTLEPVGQPEPLHRIAIEPASAGDEDKLSTALGRLTDEDPSLRVVQDSETGQLLLAGYGPAHVDVALARMARRYGVQVTRAPVRVAYRETVAGPGTGVGKHVKQSGGHGQYGIAHIEIEPLPRGEEFVFENRIVGGVIPRQWIPSVERGVREAMARGILAGYSVVDVLVRLVDGKHHSVDSSDMAFQAAGSLAFRSAAEDAGMVLLEPYVRVEVTVPDALTGDVMGDLSARRGRIQGTESAGPGRSLVSALVPEAELITYVTDLRSLSSGNGSVTMAYDHHDEVPDHVARAIIAERE